LITTGNQFGVILSNFTSSDNEVDEPGNGDHCKDDDPTVYKCTFGIGVLVPNKQEGQLPVQQ